MHLNPSNRLETIPFDEQEIRGSIPDRFARIVSTYPKRLAVISGELALTYGDLGDISDRIAQALRARLGDQAEAIALLITHGATTVIALMGVIKAGKFYCALDPDDPVNRSRTVLANLQARLLIADQKCLPRARQIAPSHCIVTTLEELESHPLNRDLQGLILNHATRAAIYYTSGTTGEPKGIPRDHYGMLYRAWLDSVVLGLKPVDCLVMLRRFMFSGSSGDIYSALLSGATLCIYDVKQLGISMLPAYLNSEKITIFRPPIELLRYFLDNLEKNASFPSVRCIALSGDVLYKKDIAVIRSHFSKDVSIVYQLSASETGVLARWVIDADTQIDTDIVPVGFPVPGKEILILDDNSKILGPEQIGQICVRTGLTPSQEESLPDFMENQFIADPDDPRRKVFLTGDIGRMRRDGLLEFVGRKDFQAKIRGYRVNTPAVVSKLMEVNGVRRAAVITKINPAGEKQLVAYLIPAPRARLSAESLRASLAHVLPDYMLPTVFVFMDQIPVNANGKIDYLALPDPDWSHPEVHSKPLPPRDDVEWRLVNLWKAALGVEQIGIQDDFFALGGHSLTAADLVVRIEKEFGKNLYPAILLENNTVERLAQV